MTGGPESSDWSRAALQRRFGLKVGIGIAVLLVFILGAVLFAFQKSIDRSGASQPEPEISSAIGEVADAIDALAERIPATSDEPVPTSGAGQSTTNGPAVATGYTISPSWWVLIALAFALLYYVFKEGAPDWAKIIVAWAGAVSAIAAAATALIGVYEAWRNANAPRDEALAIRRFVEFVPTAPQTSVFVLPDDISVVQGAETLLTFAIPYGEASCNTDASGRWPNTYPSGQSETFIRRLANGLASCADSVSKPVVEVRGFASSSEVRGYEQCGVDNTDDANRDIANRRGEEAAKLLREVGGSSLDVEAPAWTTFAQMRDDREYNDRLLNNQYSSARATLTRRVEIRVRSAGVCAAAPIPASATTPIPASAPR